MEPSQRCLKPIPNTRTTFLNSRRQTFLPFVALARLISIILIATGPMPAAFISSVCWESAFNKSPRRCKTIACRPGSRENIRRVFHYYWWIPLRVRRTFRPVSIDLYASRVETGVLPFTKKSCAAAEMSDRRLYLTCRLTTGRSLDVLVTSPPNRTHFKALPPFSFTKLRVHLIKRPAAFFPLRPTAMPRFIFGATRLWTIGAVMSIELDPLLPFWNLRICWFRKQNCSKKD